MGCAFKRWEMVTYLPARFKFGHCAPYSSKAHAAMRPQHTDPACQLGWSLSYRSSVSYYPERYPKTEALMVKAPVFFRAPSNFAMFRPVKRKYLKQLMDWTACQARFDRIFIIF